MKEILDLLLNPQKGNKIATGVYYSMKYLLD